jgi:pimeloyl-ACP methyl ester carboxylesterase
MTKLLFLVAFLFALLIGAASLLILFRSGSSRAYREVVIPANGYSIKGYLSGSTNPQGNWVIFGHGNRKEGQSHPLYREILGSISNEVGVLAIDFRGFGGSSSEGLAGAEKILDRSEDLESAVKFLLESQGVSQDRIVLMGHSFGAAQVVGEAPDHAFRLIVPIGLGDWELALSQPAKMREYRLKFQENTGVLISEEQFVAEGRQFTPQSIFGSCPQTPVVFIFAAQDDGKKSNLLYFQDSSQSCPLKMRWLNIPLANHSYGTENARLPGLLQGLYSRITLALLEWQINHLLLNLS